MTLGKTVLHVAAALLMAATSAQAGLFSPQADLPPGAHVEKDLAYGPDTDQRLDVYIPAGAAHAPIILMVHGGAWAIGDKDLGSVVDNKLAHWLPKGVIFVSVDYRMVPKADPVLQADDVARALAFVQARAAQWGGDPARVVLMGHSAGAHLVAMIEADPEIARRAGARPWLGAVVLDSGALDLVKIMEAPHYRLYDRAFGKDPAYWVKASPWHRLNAKPQPMLIVCSTRREDSCPQARGFAEKARSFGGVAGVFPVDLSHREINVTLGLAGAYTETVDAFLRSLGLF